MRTFLHYHPASGSFYRRSVLEDGEPLPGDWIETNADPETQYLTADGEIGTRLPATLTVDKPLVASGETATVTCPDPCWLRVNGAFVQAAGTYALSASEPGRITVRLAGAHVGPEIVVTVGDAIDTAFAADPRWQALQAATPAQIDNWLAANVTTLAQARQVLRMLVLAVRRLARE